MHKLTSRNREGAGKVTAMLARAFLNDPLYLHVVPDLETRTQYTSWDMGCLVRYGLQFGEVMATPSLDGCAIWLPPGETDFTEERMAEVDMVNAARQIGEQAATRMDTFISATEIVHKRLVPSPHWYLVVLGVDPQIQGKGIGSALLSEMLPRVDATKVPVYLETTNRNNPPFYQRFGFEVCHQEALPANGPRIWYLVRQPIGKT